MAMDRPDGADADGLGDTPRAPSTNLSTTDARNLADAEPDIAERIADAANAIQHGIDLAHATFERDRSDAWMSIGAIVGLMDSELREHSGAVYTAIDRASTAVQRPIYEALAELHFIGVSNSLDPREIADDLADDTGERVIARLMAASSALPTIPVEQVPQIIDAAPIEPTPGVAPPVEPIPVRIVVPQPIPAPIPQPIPIPGPIPQPVPIPIPIPIPGPIPQPVPPPPTQYYPLPGVAPLPVPPPTPWPVPPVPAPQPVPIPTPVPVPPAGTGVACPAPVVQCPAPPDVTVNVHVPPPAPQTIRTAPVSIPAAVSVPAQWSVHTHGVLWASSDICKRLDTEVKRTFDPERYRPDQGGADVVREVTDVESFIGAIVDAHKVTARMLVGADENFDPISVAQNMLGDLASTVAGAAVAEPVLELINPLGVPDRAATGRLATKIGIADLASSKSRIPLDYLVQTERYLMQFSAPMYIPSQAELDGAYLANVISADQWTCLTRAHGNIPECATWGVTAGQARPGVSEVVSLQLRGYYADDKAFAARLRQQGVMDQTYIGEWMTLAQWIPQPPDIIRFMVRDTFDQSAVDRAGLDTDFEAKLYGPGGKENPGPAARWMRANGFSEETARMFWRAHWELPSPTQLYEMLHRLRPDRPEVQSWDFAASMNGVDAATAQLGPRPQIVTEQMAREMLQQQDLAPRWIDRLMAVSYRPMTRTDALGAYHANVMDGAELVERLMDTGLDRPTAERTVQLQESLRARRTANVSGVWTVRKVAKAYASGALPYAEAVEILAPIVPDIEQREGILRGVDLEQRAEIRQRAVQRQRRAYITGAQDEAVTELNLRNLGLTAERITTLVKQWYEDRHGRYKEVSARNVLDWLKVRIISSEGAFERLVRLGYTPQDANYMITFGLKGAEKEARIETSRLRAEVKHIIKDEKEARAASARELTAREKEIGREKERLERELRRIRGELADRDPDTLDG